MQYQNSLTLGGEPIEQSSTEVHLGIDRNVDDSVDIAAKVQTGRRTMYVLMESGAYGCSGVAPPLIAHLWKTYALPKMTFQVNIAQTAVYGILGVRPMELELDLRKLTRQGNVLSNRDTVEYQIAQRQLAVKSR